MKLEIGDFHESKTLETKRVSLTVHPFGNVAESFNLSKVFVLPSFNLADVDTLSLNTICQQNPHLNGIKFPQLLHNQIGIILGQDNFDLIRAQTVVKGDSTAPRGSNRHRLGYWRSP